MAFESNVYDFLQAELLNQFQRNGGRNKHGRGHVKFIHCSNCGKCCPKNQVCLLSLQNSANGALVSTQIAT
uniref:40S ribosomal protein S26 n=1 Tax=Fagus sylvatica TaxID=28930 RepID=A0A2N9FBC4_FAGSY